MDRQKTEELVKTDSDLELAGDDDPSHKDGVSERLLFCLCSLAFLYVSGGFLFSYLERERELETYTTNRMMLEEMQNAFQWDQCNDPMFKDFEFCKDQGQFFERLKEFFRSSGNDIEDQHKFVFSGAMFFVHHLVTTIGYGSMIPLTDAGRCWAVVFGLIGIPIMGYTVSVIGGVLVENAMDGIKKAHFFASELAFLWVLCIGLILGGGLLFSSIEVWNYLSSCYFSFCTMTTVGFGDFVPTTMETRFVCMVFSLLTLGIFARLIGHLCNVVDEVSDEAHMLAEQAEQYGAAAVQRGSAAMSSASSALGGMFGSKK